jgi:WS/DGAT/MGAT family acyltransferase
MKQLGTLDAAFINLEQPATPQHLGSVAFYDPSTAPDGFVRFKQVIDNFEQRFKRLPLFRTRLVEVPGGLDKPYWVLDENFDVEFHVRHIALPQPGDWRQLCIQVARLHSRPLDMSRPLWEAYIIEGLDRIPDLPSGSFAVYTKIHHSLVDGAGSQSFITAIHDLEPSPSPGPVPADQRALLADTDPSALELLTRAAVNQGRTGLSLARGSLHLAKDLVKVGIGVLRERIPRPEINAPKTRFNQPVGPHRVFEATAFKLEEFRAIKDVTGVKINDVALAVVAGGMRKYLHSKGELPDESLAATLPLNMRNRRDQTSDNNQVGSAFCELHTNIADPLERLQAVHRSTQQAKEFSENAPLTDTLKLAGVFPPWMTKTAARLYSENEVSRSMPLNISTVVTNVAGPNFDLYCAGARLVRYYGLGVLTPGLGLFHALFSASGVITLSVLAERDQLPDPDFYRQCLEASFEELKRAVLGKTRRPRTVRRAALVKKKATVTRLPSRKRAKSKADSSVVPSKVAKKSSGARKKVAAAGRGKAAVKARAGENRAKPDSEAGGGKSDDRVIH